MMYIAKKVIHFIVKGIGVDRINSFLQRAGVKYEIAKRGVNYYNYYWYKAKKKIDLRTLNSFWKTASRVIEEQRTIHYYDRLYVLWQSVLSLPSPEYPVAEIGTYKGGTAKFIIETLRTHGYKNEFFVFDTFEGHVLVDQRWDGRHVIGNFSDTSYEEVKAYLNAPNVTIHKGNFLETAQLIDQIPNFGMVHIDVDIYPITKFCLEFFQEHTVPGSILVVDDYGNLNCKGAKKAVDEFVQTNSYFKMFYLLTGQALLVKFK